MQANFNNGVGDADRRFFNLNIQPVVPFQFPKWNVISRTIIPLNGVPVADGTSDFGFGDTTMSLFFSPNKASSVTWGVGPIFGIPTASNPELLGSGKLSLGVSGVFFAARGKFTFGAVASNLWSVAGDSDREDVNFFSAQYFVNFNFGAGWAIGSAPILSANWKADSGEQWTVPWGLQISKITKFGTQPVNLLLGYYSNSEYPTGGADEQYRFQINFMFPQAVGN